MGTETLQEERVEERYKQLAKPMNRYSGRGGH